MADDNKNTPSILEFALNKLKDPLGFGVLPNIEGKPHIFNTDYQTPNDKIVTPSNDKIVIPSVDARDTALPDDKEVREAKAKLKWIEDNKATEEQKPEKDRIKLTQHEKDLLSLDTDDAGFVHANMEVLKSHPQKLTVVHFDVTTLPAGVAPTKEDIALTHKKTYKTIIKLDPSQVAEMISYTTGGKEGTSERGKLLALSIPKKDGGVQVYAIPQRRDEKGEILPQEIQFDIYDKEKDKNGNVVMKDGKPVEKLIFSTGTQEERNQFGGQDYNYVAGTIAKLNALFDPDLPQKPGKTAKPEELQKWLDQEAKSKQRLNPIVDNARGINFFRANVVDSHKLSIVSGHFGRQVDRALLDDIIDNRKAPAELKKMMKGQLDLPAEQRAGKTGFDDKGNLTLSAAEKKFFDENTVMLTSSGEPLDHALIKKEKEIEEARKLGINKKPLTDDEKEEIGKIRAEEVMAKDIVIHEIIHARKLPLDKEKELLDNLAKPAEERAELGKDKGFDDKGNLILSPEEQRYFDVNVKKRTTPVDDMYFDNHAATKLYGPHQEPAKAAPYNPEKDPHKNGDEKKNDSTSVNTKQNYEVAHHDGHPVSPLGSQQTGGRKLS